MVYKFYNKSCFGNSYAVVNGNEFILIDCTQTLQNVANKIGSFYINNKLILGKGDNKLYCRGVFITHAHYDHIKNLSEWINNGANIYATNNAFLKMNSCDNMCKEFDCELFVDVPKKNRVVLDNIDSIDLISKKIQILHLLGHTNCSICLIIDKDIFVGDIIFNGGVYGRCDLPTGNIVDMEKSLAIINKLDSGLLVHSGHGLDFRLGDYKPYKI